MKIRIGNRQIAVFSVLMMLFIFGTPRMEVIAQDAAPPIAQPASVTIPDENLKAAIREGLELDAADPITPADMLRLTTLEAIDANVSALTGLEHATNLTRLGLPSNSISDISSLSGLTSLTELNLGSNDISDISPLSGLTNLIHLNLEINYVRDISGLSGLTSLTELNLGSNDISDISPLSGLTNLTHLFLGINHIVDVSGLSGLTNLEVLFLIDNLIWDTSPLYALATEHNVVISGITVSESPPPLANIPDDNLKAAIRERFDYPIDERPITVGDMLKLTGHPSITTDRGITDLTGLELATNLTGLTIDNNDIVSVSPLFRIDGTHAIVS